MPQGPFLRKYGAATTVNFSLFEVDGVDFRVDAVHASGDSVIMKDEGAETNTASGFVDEGSGYSIALSAGEMTCARAVVHLIDQTATKVWLDDSLIIETYGNASAQHAFDLDTATVSLTAASITTASFAAGAIDAAAIADGAIDDATLAADVDTYQGKIWMVDDNSGTTDRYMVVWHKNGQPVVSSITSPTIQVIKAADGTDLVASTAMTEIGALGLYKYDEATNRMVDGAGYIAKVEATIDAATRTWYQPISRDSA